MNDIFSSRRGFIAGAAAFSLSGCLAPGGALSGRPNVKFGVVSDIHITDWTSTLIFRKALRHFRDEGVDAVMIVGDMADHGILPQLENVSRAWYEVFPDDTAPDGRHVEKLFVYGNHDPEGLAYRDAAMDKAFAVHGLTYEQAAKLELRKIGLAKCWEQCFNEEYSPIYIKNVNGYDFIGGHWDTWQGIRGLEDWFKENISKVNTDQPFFYFQHATPAGTIYGSDSWGDDEGQSTRCLAPYQNAVAFSGHSHRPLTDKRSYWRGEFTSIGTSTLSYVCLPSGRKGRPNYRTNLDARHGQIVSVYDDRMVIVRRDFIHDENLDEALVFSVPAKPSSYSVRALLKRERPVFPAGTTAELKLRKNEIEVSFNGAFANPTARPFEYEVKFEVEFEDPKKKRGSVSSLWFQPDAVFSRKRAAAKKVKASIALKELPKGAVKVRAIVISRNSYGGTGHALISEWMKV